jgi:DNA-binding transcriptional MerR regulator
MNLADLALFASQAPETAEDDERRGQKSDTAYRTISEVATDLDLPQHVLRFWETKFKQISPMKRAGGRRYYRPQDIELIRRIHYLLHTQGYTIKGVQKLLLKDRALQQNVPMLLEGDGARVVVNDALQRKANNDTAPVVQQAAPGPAAYVSKQTDLQSLLDKLKEMRSHIDERC